MLRKFKTFENRVWAKVMCGLGVLVATISSQFPTIAHADSPTPTPVGGSLDWLTNTQDKTLDSLNQKVQGVGSSAYKLTLSIGIIGLLLSIVGVGISMVVNKSAQKKQESKDHLVWICIGGIVIFGATAIIGLIQAIGSGLEF